MDKIGQMGMSVESFYKIFMVAIIAFVVLGLSFSFYDYEVDVKDSEAVIFARLVVDCLAPNGVLDLDVLSEKYRENVFDYCGIGESGDERFFVSVGVSDSVREIDRLVGGDEGAEWVRKIYTSGLAGESIKKYEPGYYNGNFPVGVVKGGAEGRGSMGVEVIVER